MKNYERTQGRFDAAWEAGSWRCLRDRYRPYAGHRLPRNDRGLRKVVCSPYSFWGAGICRLSPSKAKRYPYPPITKSEYAGVSLIEATPISAMFIGSESWTRSIKFIILVWTFPVLRLNDAILLIHYDLSDLLRLPGKVYSGLICRVVVWKMGFGDWRCACNILQKNNISVKIMSIFGC